MAKKGFKQDEGEIELAQDEAPIIEPQIKEPPAKEKPTAAKELTSLEKACAAIAALRQNDVYVKKEAPDFVQYRSGDKRLVVNVNKQRVKGVPDDAGANKKASEFLAAYRSFTKANVLDAKQVGDGIFVVTTDGKKYRYDLVKGVLA